MTYVTTSSMMFDVSNNLFLQFPSRLCQLVRRNRASDISRGRGPAKFRYFREIRQKYFQIHVGKTYLILILAITPVLFTPNVQI